LYIVRAGQDRFRALNGDHAAFVDEAELLLIGRVPLRTLLNERILRCRRVADRPFLPDCSEQATTAKAELRVFTR
jgi:hypothetical protein